MFQSETCTKADTKLFLRNVNCKKLRWAEKKKPRNAVESSEKYLSHPFRFRPQHDHTAPASTVKTPPVVTTGDHFFLYECKIYVVGS